MVIFGLGPLYSMVIQPRLVSRCARRRIRRRVLGTDLALVARVALLCALVGSHEFLLVQAPAVLLAGGAGGNLFYMQHQFEGAYWRRP